MIVAKDLVKEFKIYQHHRGAFGAIRNMFSTKHTIVRAVDQISFQIAAGEL
ncbi:MAG TPA: ABC transporter ATP-binding protein, partial [Firmicutes bacterium]|nr:ABC transporter ATP-binding protein [Bacillota bacterium]HBR24449.1 ABC transporter ATP-binding protein [Bacillota bacterium]HCF92894.1 ABC transporter ATP-binding protein [Bacillota bacterium]HCM17882.1 ABC transporter ATP-binding protein [Bacillota bacterium]